MKKLFLTISILLIGLFSFSQNSYFIGGFYSTKNYVYFMGSNTTDYNLSITIIAVNETKNQQKVWYLDSPAHSNFTISPNDGWKWEINEKLYIKFNNGQLIYWVYSLKSIPFKGLVAKKSCQKAGCNCMKYKSEAGSDYPHGIWCKNCNHHIDYHIK
jgi:hypothetical protein